MYRNAVVFFIALRRPCKQTPSWKTPPRGPDKNDECGLCVMTAPPPQLTPWSLHSPHFLGPAIVLNMQRASLLSSKVWLANGVKSMYEA